LFILTFPILEILEIDCASPDQQLEIGFCYYKAIDTNPYSAEIEAAYDNHIDLTSEYRLSWRLKHSGGTENCRVHETGAGKYELCDMIDIAIQSKTVGWLGIGFMSDGINHGMKDTDIVWGRVYDDGTANVIDAKALATDVPTPDIELADCPLCVDDLLDVSGAEDADTKITTLKFSRYLSTGDPSDTIITQMETKPVVFAYSRVGNDGQVYHGPSRGFANIQFWTEYPACEIENGDFIVSVEENCNDGSRLVTVEHALPLEERRCVGDPPLSQYKLDCLYVEASGSTGTICTVFGLLSMFASLACLGWVVKNYKLPIVKMSQRQFCVAICVGAVLLSSSMLLYLGTQERLFVDCQLPLWLFHLGFDLLFIPLFLKVNRTYQILQNKKLKAKKITNKKLTLEIVALISVDVLLLILWQATNAYQPTDVYEAIPGLGIDTPTPSRVCRSEDTVFTLLVSFYKGGLMIAGCYYSYQAFNVSDIFAEAKPIMACLYLIGCQSMMVLALTYGIEGISASGKLLIQSIAVAIGIVNVLGGLFVPKKLKYGHITSDKELWNLNRDNGKPDAAIAHTTVAVETATVSPIIHVPETAAQYAEVLSNMVDEASEYHLKAEILLKAKELLKHFEQEAKVKV
jgi:hypothetical protein